MKTITRTICVCCCLLLLQSFRDLSVHALIPSVHPSTISIPRRWPATTTITTTCLHHGRFLVENPYYYDHYYGYSNKVGLHRLHMATTTSSDGDSNSNEGPSEQAVQTSEEEIATSSSSSSSSSRLDTVLSRLTSAFPLFVLFAAIAGGVRPCLLDWVNANDNIISTMLATVMIGMGLTLEKSDFTQILYDKKQWKVVPLGVACQFTIMPLAAAAVGRALLLSTIPTASAAASSEAAVKASALFLGLALVGCAPGGTASNLVSLIAGADVALSVLLTSCSTLLAVVATPLFVKLLIGGNMMIKVSGMALCQATARVVFLPILLGMVLKAKAPKLARFVSRFTPFASVLLVSLICGGVIAQTASLVVQQQGTTMLAGGLLVRMVLSVFCLHAIGFGVGYILPKLVAQTSERQSRTISIEVGMQNSALAVVLARSIAGAHPLASLPGALSATVHSCLGSMLAAYWRLRDANDNQDGNKNKKKDSRGVVKHTVTLSDETDAPEFSI